MAGATGAPGAGRQGDAESGLPAAGHGHSHRYERCPYHDGQPRGEPLHRDRRLGDGHSGYAEHGGEADRHGSRHPQGTAYCHRDMVAAAARAVASAIAVGTEEVRQVGGEQREPQGLKAAMAPAANVNPMGASSIPLLGQATPAAARISSGSKSRNQVRATLPSRRARPRWAGS